MERQIEELTILLIDLASWEDNLGTKKNPIKVLRSWKSYPFNMINSLIEKYDLRGSFRAKSIVLTKHSATRTEQLKEQYLHNDTLRQYDNCRSVVLLNFARVQTDVS